MDERLKLTITLITIFISAIAGPISVYIYKKKYDAFYTAVRALTHLYLDATKGSGMNYSPLRGGLTEDTHGLLMKAGELVKVHFSKTAYKLYDRAHKSKLSRGLTPNFEFNEKKDMAIERMKRELFLGGVPTLLFVFIFLAVILYFVYIS